MLAGYTIVHPYRGPHNRDDKPGELRRKLDRANLSIHCHGIAVGYWSKPQKTCYYKSQCMIDVRMWADEQMQIISRDRIMAKLLYDLNHAGWYGDRGQCVSQWGSITDHTDKDYYRPPEPGIWIAHPTMTHNDEPVWEKRKPPDHEIWEELRREISQPLMDERYGHKTIEWRDEIPDGTIVGTYPWYSLSSLETMPDHTTWGFWRLTIQAVITALITG